MVVAAEASGYATEVVLDPGGKPNLVATVGLRSAPARGSELYRAIGMRRSDRSKFTVAHVPAQALGLVSLGLAAVIGVAALAWPRATTTGRGLAVMAAMALPAAVGLTTTGAVWIPAALVGAFAAVLLLAIGLPLVFGGNRAHRVMTR
jgi:hypothetical protein